MASTAIIIPSRLGSTRLKSKALLTIGDKTLIEQVWSRAKRVPGVKVYVATDHADIAAAVQAFGGQVLMTSCACPTGSDRVAEALSQIPADIEQVINLQGDLPFINPEEVLKVLDPLRHGFDVGTLVACMPEEKQKNPHFVKAILSKAQENVMHCHWFCRASMPYGHHHLGVYAYTREALTRFANTPPHPLERQEGLEQLRFLTLGYRIGASLVNSLAHEVNTQEDLESAQQKLMRGEVAYD